MEWYMIVGAIGLIIVLIIIFRKKNGEEDSFINKTIHRIDLGCGKLIKRIRGC